MKVTKKNICSCGKKIVYFTRRTKRKPKFDLSHDLCMKCYRSHRDRLRPKDYKRKRIKQ